VTVNINCVGYRYGKWLGGSLCMESGWEALCGAMDWPIQHPDPVLDDKMRWVDNVKYQFRPALVLS